jgi:hypothetical protein
VNGRCANFSLSQWSNGPAIGLVIKSQKLRTTAGRFRELRFRHNLARQLRPINPLEHSCPKWSMASVLTIVLMVAGLP